MNKAETMLHALTEGYKTIGHEESVYSFILEHGVPFNRVTTDISGPAKECYMNSVRRSTRDPSLTYCEGYVVGEDIPIPILHAWIVDEFGMLIETTLRRDTTFHYFGIPYKREFVRRQMVEWGVYGILGGDHRQTRDLMSGKYPVDTWLDAGLIACLRNAVPTIGSNGRVADL